MALATVSTGCIENMDDLKQTLGVKAPPPPVPVYAPPVAKAQANATDVLVGVPVSFLSDGTKDPQKLPLDYEWDFADGQRAKGAYATHSFRAPGEYGVKLYATNLGGLTDEDVVVVRVSPADRSPTVAIRVTGSDGVATLRTTTNSPLSFDAIASDPEGTPLSYVWDLADGTTSREAAVAHAFVKPGVYDVRLTVADRAGNTAVSVARISVDLAMREGGAFEPTGNAQQDVTFFVAAKARTLTLLLTFPGGTGLNDLELVVLDANGAEVVKSAAEPTPGNAGEASRTLTVEAFAVPGEWTARVVRERGLSIAWSLDIKESVLG